MVRTGKGRCSDKNNIREWLEGLLLRWMCSAKRRVFNRRQASRQAVGIGRLRNMLNNYAEFASQIPVKTRKMIPRPGGPSELSQREPFSVEPLLIQLFVSIQFSPDYANYMWTQSFRAFARSFLSLEWIIKVTLTWAKIMLKDFETLHVGIDVKAAPDWLVAGWLVLPLTWIYGVLREAEKKTVNESPRVMKSTFCLFYVRNFTLTEIFP